MTMDHALGTFITESRELLADMEQALLACGQGDRSADTVNAIFRAAHTIKGSAGLFGLDRIVSFTHVVESLLDKIRHGEIELAGKLVTLLLACGDHIGDLVNSVDGGDFETDQLLDRQGEPLLAQLHACMGTGGALTESEASSVERIAAGEIHLDNWHISLRFGAEVLRNGMDPLSFIRYLCTIGEIVSLMTVTDDVPGSDDMDPEACYLGFEIAFKSNADKATIESVFDFVRDDCRIRIIPPKSKIAEYIRLIDGLPQENSRLGEMLVRAGTITAAELEEALAIQSEGEPAEPLGTILIEHESVPAAVVEAALAKQNQIREAKTQESRSVRVDAQKLDRLINLIGELITTAASANMIARRTQNHELQECGFAMSNLVEDVRESALQLRMVKIGATFSRFHRVVYDVAQELGKDIALTVSGEDTELDKTVVEKIADPLTHLVRNAIDHGIEPVDVRVAAGKPPQGTIRLNAYHDSGTIVIEVSDDGGGLKKAKILDKAIQLGLVDANRQLSDSEICNLIFEPGFSTADKITNLSGRGVGMDVVKRNIVALRGTIGIRTEEGAGTTMTVRLPLTLAIIKGFQVGLGRSVYVVPLDMVEECVEFAAEPGHDYANLRGEILPFIRLREIFDVAEPAGKRQSIVVVKYAGQRAGLVVDSLIGESQTVIKPLGKAFQQVKCISGSSILGSGEVALILDVPALVQQAHAKAKRTGDERMLEYSS